MTNELLNEWKKEKIVEDGDIVLAGVSGGADSVCLLLMLEQLQKKTDFLLFLFITIMALTGTLAYLSSSSALAVGRRAGKMQRL